LFQRKKIDEKIDDVKEKLKIIKKEYIEGFSRKKILLVL